MYRPIQRCGSCTPVPVSGQSFFQRLRSKTAAKAKEADTGIDPQAGVEKTGQLYRIPRVDLPSGPGAEVAHEQITWPRFRYGKYSSKGPGETMLALSEAEIKALQVVVLVTNVKKEAYGSIISQGCGIGSPPGRMNSIQQVYAASPASSSC